MIVYKNTQRLFWKKWPYKVILGTNPGRSRKMTRLLLADSFNPVQNLTRNTDTYIWSLQFFRWFTTNFSDCRIRRETNISVFVNTEEQVKEVVDNWKKYVIEVWSPVNQNALTLMSDHINDVIRAKPWYNEYNTRLVIPYTKELKSRGLDQLVSSIMQLEQDKWHAGGTLKLIIECSLSTLQNNKKLQKQIRHLPYSHGQILYLYLKDIEDAIMLKLQFSEWIERIERQRNPLDL